MIKSPNWNWIVDPLNGDNGTGKHFLQTLKFKMDTLVCADYQVLVVCLHISCAQGVLFLSYVLIYNFFFSNVQFLKFNESVVSAFFSILSKKDWVLL